MVAGPMGPGYDLTLDDLDCKLGCNFIAGALCVEASIVLKSDPCVNSVACFIAATAACEAACPCEK